MFSARNTTFKDLTLIPAFLCNAVTSSPSAPPHNPGNTFALALFHWGTELTATQVANETRTLEGVT